MRLAAWDWVVVAVYAVVIIAVGLRVGRKQHTSEGYFLAGRRLRWPFIVAGREEHRRDSGNPETSMEVSEAMVELLSGTQ